MLWYVREGSIRLNDMDVRVYVLSNNVRVFERSDITQFITGEEGSTLEQVFTSDIFGPRIYFPKSVNFTALGDPQNIISGFNAETEFPYFVDTLYLCKLDIDKGTLQLPTRYVRMIERVVFMSSTAHQIGVDGANKKKPTLN
jgi:hypothetical protein